MLDRAVVQYEIDENPDAAAVGFAHEPLEVGGGAVVAIHFIVVRYIVAVITGRLCDRHQPDAVCAEIADVVELFRQPREVSHTVAVAVIKGPDKDLVTDSS